MNHNLFIVIIGNKYSASYLIYTEIMKSLAIKPFVLKSFVYFGEMTPIDKDKWMKTYKVDKYPVLVAFYQGKIVSQSLDLPGKSSAEKFLMQIMFQCMMKNLEGEAEVKLYYKENLNKKFKGKF